MKATIFKIIIFFFFLLLLNGCDSFKYDSNENDGEKVDELFNDINEATQYDFEVDENTIDNNKIDDTISKNEEIEVKDVVVEPTIELDIANSDELILGLLSSVNYNEVYNEYKKFYSNDDVERIQKKLKEIGVNCGEIDGYIGKKTVASIVHFQMFYNLNVTGIVDESTASKLHLDYNDLDVYQNKYGKLVTFSLDKSYLAYNNSVGNEWGTSVEVNGTNIKYDTYTMSMKKGESVRIDVAASENDKVVDYGSNSVYIYYNNLERGYYYTIELEVIVRENRGRYSGNTAKWIFLIRVDVK